jgi:hypothetical protein
MDTMAKDKSTEYAKFTRALGKVLKVSHSEMKTKMEAEKKQRTQKSGGKDNR